MVVSTYNIGMGDAETGDATVQSHCEHQVSRGHKVKSCLKPPNKQEAVRLCPSFTSIVC